jgi:serine/threonine protein kinase
LERKGTVHLVDFGIARFFEDATLTSTGALVGTPMYMSPEQVTGRFKVDHRSDIYSLGLVLYELLTLQRPITATTREGILRQIVTKAIVPVSWKNRSVSKDLESVVHKSTANDPDERYQSAEAFASDLENVLNRKQVQALPYRYKFDRSGINSERPGSVVAASIVFFVLAFVGIISALNEVEGIALRWSGGPGSPTSKGLWSLSVISLAYGVLSLWIARGLLAGRESARRTAVWSIIPIGIVFAVMIDASEYLFKNPTFTVAMIIRFLIAAIYLLPLLCVIELLRAQPVRDWFGLAERCRIEHLGEMRRSRVAV